MPRGKKVERAKDRPCDSCGESTRPRRPYRVGLGEGPGVILRLCDPCDAPILGLVALASTRQKRPPVRP